MSKKGENSREDAEDKILKRLNRIEGQIKGVKKMIIEKRDCTEILMQTSAIRSAMKNAEGKIVETHLSNCIEENFSSVNKSKQMKEIEEFVKIFKKLGN